MLKYHRKTSAFTMIELIVATGLLSLVIISAFSLSSSSNKSFEAGTWRINRQKSAQLFLLRFKETIERANHANMVSADGNTTRIGTARDITIASPWYNKIASTTNSGILFASSFSPARAAVPELGMVEKKGVWKGISLESFNKSLSLFQTGNWNVMLSSTPVSAGSVDVSKFELNNLTGDFVISLDDVDAIGIFPEVATESVALKRPEMLLTLKIFLIKPNSGGKVRLTEEITAKICDRKETEIVAGGTAYKVSQGRKK